MKLRRLMRARYHLLLSVIFSVLSGLWPVMGLAFSVERSAYDWFLAETDNITIEVTAGDARRAEDLEFSLVRLDFSEGTDVPKILPLSEELASIFSVDKTGVELSGRDSLRVSGGELRLEGRGLVLGLRIIKKPIFGGLTAEQGVVVPIFLRGRIQDVNLELENLNIPWFQTGELRAGVEIRNKGEDTVVPKGRILYRNLLSREVVEIEINPTKRRLPPGVKREFYLSADLGEGWWRGTVSGVGGESSRMFVVMRPGFLAGGALLIAILMGLVIRHVFKKRTI